LEWCHGYNSNNSKNNIFSQKDGTIVYNAAGLGVVYDVKSNTQKFFDLHIDDVTAIDYCEATGNVATGELGPRPSIYVWNGLTM
jgi:hypothetical protein